MATDISTISFLSSPVTGLAITGLDTTGGTAGAEACCATADAAASAHSDTTLTTCIRDALKFDSFGWAIAEVWAEEPPGMFRAVSARPHGPHPS